MGPDLIAAITDIAARQHGAVSAPQLRRCGMTARQQARAVAAGWLRMAQGSILVVAGSPDSWLRDLHVGSLALGDSCWVSHEAAAALHGFDQALAGAVEFSLPRSCRGRTCGWPVHTTDALGPHDVVTIDGLRCASATRTIIDLARAGAAPRRLEAAIDSAVRSGRTAPVVLERRLVEVTGPARPLRERLSSRPAT